MAVGDARVGADARTSVRDIVALARTASPVAGAAISATVFGGVWWLAALHLCPPTQVGRYVALYGIAVLLSEVCSLGIGQTLIRYLTDAGDLGGAMARTGLVLVTAFLTGSVGVVAIVTHTVARQTALSSGTSATVLLLLLGMGTIWFTKTEDLLLATGHRLAQFVRASAAAAGRVVLLLMFHQHGALTLVSLALSYAVPSILASAGASLVMRRELFSGIRHGILLDPSQTKGLIPYAWQSYLGNILAAVVPNVLPAIVVWQLGTIAGARFAAAWFIASTMMLVPTAIAVTAFSTVARGERDVDRVMGHGMWLVLAIQVPLSIILLGVAHVIFLRVGAAYASLGLAELGPLLLGAIFAGLTTQIYARARLVAGGLSRIVSAQAVQAAGLLALTLLLAPRLGLTGICIAWLGGSGAGLAAAHAGELHHLKYHAGGRDRTPSGAYRTGELVHEIRGDSHGTATK